MRSNARESVGGRNPDTLSVVSVITAGLDNRLSGQMEASSLGGPLFFLYTTSYIYLKLTGAPALPLILLFPPTRHQGVHILRGGWCNPSWAVPSGPHRIRSVKTPGSVYLHRAKLYAIWLRLTCSTKIAFTYNELFFYFYFGTEFVKENGCCWNFKLRKNTKRDEYVFVCMLKLLYNLILSYMIIW